MSHTPDNSFLGFVVEQHLNASDIQHIDDIKRQNQSLVYGKVDNFWKVKHICDVAAEPRGVSELKSSSSA
ncbi:Alpha-1,6-mannosylglycoprotein 6-beta-N-acetylglucosaminyltransferase A [Liparis tanakae]|uniref:alpha-1,6-mannosyl-glycoprotein 6-beta-N-acetylglucosaminyltransferase n=1 Tax=Liparis tanakae TaxID=230148 RepID=A0A4Z2G556_9TELE|nr:Alpha-1,6-mannosylglycoprotein 6-beta-N-acetylglucosaminyltransferase A [Liparis tanakae]